LRKTYPQRRKYRKDEDRGHEHDPRGSRYFDINYRYRYGGPFRSQQGSIVENVMEGGAGFGNDPVEG